MSARTSWNARNESTGGQPLDEGEAPDTAQAGDVQAHIPHPEIAQADIASNDDLPLEDLLGARFDAGGRLVQIGRGAKQRSVDRLDPRPPALSAEELELAVQKLARGLDAMERQDPALRRTGTSPGHGSDRRGAPRSGRPEFVASSLDRLEARLDALSQRLEQRMSGAPADKSRAAPYGAPPAAPGPSAEEARRRLQDQRRAEEQAADEARKRAETKAAEARRAAQRAAAEEARRASEHRAKASREAELAEEQAAAEEAARRARADLAAARSALSAAAGWDSGSGRSETGDGARSGRLSDHAIAELERHFGALDARIETLQRTARDNQIEPVRLELLGLLRQVETLTSESRSLSGTMEEVRSKIGDVDSKLNAARNMATNRLAELQDRLVEVTQRLASFDPGSASEAVRLGTSQILDRVDQVEALVEGLASPDQLWERLDGLRQEIQALPSQRHTALLDERLAQLAARLDALPQEIGDPKALGRIEAQIEGLGTELSEHRRLRNSSAAELDARLAEIARTLHDVSSARVAPDLSGLQDRLAEIAERINGDRSLSGEAFGRLERQLGTVAEAVERQESDATEAMLVGLERKMDALGVALAAQDVGGARRDLDALGRKFETLERGIAEQAERLGSAQLAPLEERLDRMQTHLEEMARRSHAATAAQFGPLAQKIQELSDKVSQIGTGGAPNAIAARLASIEERIAGLSGGRAPDLRPLQDELQGIVGQLEALKTQVVTQERVSEVMERIEAVARTGLSADRFDRIEARLAGVAGDPEAAERLLRLEAKLDSLSGLQDDDGSVLGQEDLTELRDEITALRRELRSLPGLGQGESNLGEVLKAVTDRLDRFPAEPVATTRELEEQVERLAALLDDPSHSRLALAHIETSLRTIEEKIGETRRSTAISGRDFDLPPEQIDADAVAEMARAISADLGALKGSAEATERKTKDALDTVQDTLEAVIKRMAFLERDMPGGAAILTPPAVAPVEADSLADATMREPAAADLDEKQAGDLDEAFETELRSDLPPIPIALETPAPREQPASAPSLLSRFTSRQLLRRATGGRADSFSPAAEEPDDGADLPLEPGTDSPLASELSDAPSSDTGLFTGMSGRARKEARTEYRGVDAAADDGGDDVLAAARRAARFAVESDDDAIVSRSDFADLGERASFSERLRQRRGVILGCAITIAVAFAAYQLVKTRMAAPEADIASVPAAETPAETPVQSGVVAPEAATAEAPLQSDETAAADDAEASIAFAEPDAEAEPLQPVQEAEAAAEPMSGGAADIEAGVEQLEGPLQAQEPEAAPVPEPDPSETASLGAPAAAEVNPPVASPEPVVGATLPDEIGSEKLRTAALAGDPAAQFEVAARYVEGHGVSVDLPKAVEWYERAAEAGLPAAQYRLGSIYENGMGVPKDLGRAQDWYRQAADAGNVKAMHNLAVLYAEGAGGEPDLEAASQLFLKAADRGVRDSQFNIAILHARGLGVPQDMFEAYRWFAIAATSGDAEAAKRRDVIAEALTPADLDKAKAAAEAFRPIPVDPAANEVAPPEGGWGPSAEAPISGEANAELVALVQSLLAEEGFNPGPADGMFGAKTIDAIAAYQQARGLPVTGQIDTGLVATLRERST
jgi:localization factor PodJL